VYITPNSPKGWFKKRICFFANKIQVSKFKFVCYKVSLCETSSGTVAAEPFPYLMVLLAANVTLQPNIYLQTDPPPSTKADLDVLVPQP